MATSRNRAAALALASLVFPLPLALACRTSAAQASALDALNPEVRARVTCSIQAATRFSLPANLVIAVAEQEGGRSGQWVQNTNGSYDVGPLQFNTAYLQTLARYGITAKDVEAGGCYPFELAAWRIRRHLDRDAGDIWTRAANYHSKTPVHNARYRAAIRARAAKWARWLTEHVPSVEVAALKVPPAPNPPPVPPTLTETEAVAPLREVTPQVTRRAPRKKQAPAARAKAEPVTTPQPDSALGGHVHVTETLAALDARRHCQLLALVTAQPCSAATQASNTQAGARAVLEHEHARVQTTSGRTHRLARRVAAANPGAAPQTE